MPRARGARDRRSRARKKRRDVPFPLILEIEVPLTAAIHYTDALRLIGQGLILHNDEGGDAIAALAYAAGERLEAVKTIWNRMLEERRKVRRSRNPR